MNKSDIKNILISMRTADNESQVNYLLGKVDILSDKVISEYLKKIGDSEENIRNFFNKQIEKLQIDQSRRDERHPINKLFTYGISSNKNCIHLHLPGDLHQLIKSKGIKTTMDIVNLYLLDAIDKIRIMKDSRHPAFQNIDNIYMTSPILLQRELNFLEEIDFKTALYRKKDLSNKDFLSQNPEAELATYLFGTERNVGTASINLDIISSEEWQKKKLNKIKEFNARGIYIENVENIK